MKAQLLHRVPDALRQPPPVPAPAAILAQRHSTLGGGSAAAPLIVEAGRPLEPATRHEMEKGFGRDFGAIRVHDDARAHDNARALGAVAYAAGNDIVFGQGHYAPQTAPGRALIAHELAHSVQQGGVQMKADGSLPVASDARLEAEADRAALAVTAGRQAPALTRIGAPAVFRATEQAKAGGGTETIQAGPTPGLPEDVRVIKEEPAGPGATVLDVALPVLVLPEAKGAGPWVKQAYKAVAGEKRLAFTPILGSGKIKAYKEEANREYKGIWLRHRGFNTLRELARAIEDPEAAPAVKALAANSEVKPIVAKFKLDQQGGCDIDHIVEKQVGGSSVGTNLQLLIEGKNRPAGRETYNKVVKDAERILANRRYVVDLHIRYLDVDVREDQPDPSYEIEKLLQDGTLKGSDAVMQAAQGEPVALLAGGVREVIHVTATKTPIPASAEYLVHGMKLKEYRRAGSVKGAKEDQVTADIASSPISTDPGDKDIILSASLTTEPLPPEAKAGDPAPSPVTAAGEVRKLTILSAANPKIPFRYPYLSKGELTELHTDSAGKPSGKGTLTTKFFGLLDIEFAPDMLRIAKPLDVTKLNSGFSPITFTSSSLTLDLAPTLKPGGNVHFEIGMLKKKLMLGKIDATVEDGAFVAKGTLKPAMDLPGISEAKGEVRYHSREGWSGSLTAKSAGKLPNSTVDAEFAFTEKAGELVFSAKGSMVTQVAGKTLTLLVSWNKDQGIVYTGEFDWEKPFPIVDKVHLKGTYAGKELSLGGTTDFTFLKRWKGDLTVHYSQKDGEAGKLSGSASVAVTSADKKLSGMLRGGVDPAGKVSAYGQVSYQFTPEIKGTLGIGTEDDGRIKASGVVKVADLALTKKWPGPEGGKKTFFKGGKSFVYPTPLIVVDVFGHLWGSVGIGYGVGPVMLKGVTLTASLYPFETEKHVKANLVGNLSVPAYAELYGTIGATIGVELLYGAAGAEGGISITPSLRIDGEGGIDFEAAYAGGGFTFSATAYAKGKLTANLKVDLVAILSAGWGWGTWQWEYNVASWSKQLGPELKLTLGTIAYTPAGMVWPSLDQIKLEPKELDPIPMIKDMLGKRKEKKIK